MSKQGYRFRFQAARHILKLGRTYIKGVGEGRNATGVAASAVQLMYHSEVPDTNATVVGAGHEGDRLLTTPRGYVDICDVSIRYSDHG